MTAPIIAAAQHAAWLRDKLLEAYPNLREDDKALADTVEGLTDFHEIAVRIIDSAENDGAMAIALKSRIKDMQDRIARFEAREDRKRQIVATAMEAAAIRKIESPEFTISLRNNPPKVVIVDEAAIPKEFFKETITLSLDRALLKECLETDGVPGAELSNGGVSLTVRTR